MFTEIGAVLGMASFILIVISSIIKTFSEDKDWQKRIDEINLRCDVDFLKVKVDNLRKDIDMCCKCEDDYINSEYLGRIYLGKKRDCDKKESVSISCSYDDSNNSNIKYRLERLEDKIELLISKIEELELKKTERRKK